MSNLNNRHYASSARSELDELLLPYYHYCIGEPLEVMAPEEEEPIMAEQLVARDRHEWRIAIACVLVAFGLVVGTLCWLFGIY